MQGNRGTTIGRFISAVIVICLTACLSLPALAESVKNVELRMVMYLGGITAGKMKLSVDFNDQDATTMLNLKSKGVVKMMTGYKGSSQAKTILPDKAWPVPISYDSAYKTNKYDRKIEIRYNQNDGEIVNLQTWKRGEPRNSGIPKELQQATIDPLTTILHFRHWILALRNNPTIASEKTFEVFDGRRRYRLNASILDREQTRFGGRVLPVFKLKVMMEPLAGFSKRDMLANWSSEDGDRWIELTITDDDSPVPLLLETIGGTLKTSIYLTEVCNGGDRCMEFDS